ncbi:50S ribosomal protein L20 [Mycoplasmopsis fermentans]|uniref:Large ribosomal subunit protein bL20 n=3 Tax=Mycoplasmopsis fermentans TaxID=2115 RepID=RL20_MYCFE|nr:RecName: Full=Large ribosomal subunit protein bL20; AltName: Full=50S ribosomal protein L20 [Mycoplasmopsis fermentans]ADN68931.1 50S ribosomal protein L20 [Mycoplasmopsis fermentans JER]ADV34356.1 50S ribosomal protein L20 [Mycoplasmopsis fermentans M64]RMX35766.1 ribosomal protein L20 [Mycoplasmopsis fermentans MF-I2]RMX35785.1 ribosomal protein L20 [Mycoplasmopsis fermentans MF-I1]VEU67521.1 50S ribosomal protein L20 [Mesomycoplasma conjunctivae]
MRVKGGTVTRARRKKWLKLAKGYFGHKSIGYKVAKQAVVKSWTYAFRDRKQIKREFRKLWIARINAATRAEGLSYSKFINGLKRANVTINRKMLSELAISEPKTFAMLIKIARDAK